MTLKSLMHNHCILIQNEEQYNKIRGYLRGEHDPNITFPIYVAKRQNTFGLQDEPVDNFGKLLKIIPFTELNF